MKRKYTVRHPAGWDLVGSQGYGGPALPVLPTNPQPGAGSLPSNPFVPGPTIPGVPVPVPAIPNPPSIPNPLQGISDAIGKAVKDYVSAGEVLAGVVLIVVGLLLATGLLERGARTAARVAPIGRAASAIRR